ncbi:alpha/beta hydrolase [Oligoflexia bacterium]|nr:alpha/beta hydrolase [Oligoflexia bacterium]
MHSLPVLLIILILVVAAYLYLAQHKMIYFPKPYDDFYFDELPGSVLQIPYQTGAGNQVAFYFPPRDRNQGVPRVLWIMFGGNGSLALDWQTFILQHPDAGAGFLLVDYPGFGKNEGNASPESILSSSVQAFKALAKLLQVDEAALTNSVALLGHSLGAAAALLLALQYHPQQLILISPFTTMLNMAKRRVGIPLCYILKHRYNNRAHIAQLVALPQPPRITIFHGDRDEVIPVKMGRALYAAFPQAIKYVEVKGADHNSILDDAEVEIYAAMQSELNL